MSVLAARRIVGTSFGTSLRRYTRSWGLWALVLLAPIGAKLWIGAPGSAAIAVDDKAPVMTSAMLGVSLGIVVSTLLLPVAFIFFRSNVTRRQPWQVEDVTSGSRVALALGHFLADVAIGAAALAAMTLAGFILGIVNGTSGGFVAGEILFGLWAVALPAVMMTAALRRFFDALPWTRRAPGDLIAFGLWFATLTAASAGVEQGNQPSAIDLPGFVQPLSSTLAPGKHDLMIGGGPETKGTIALDVAKGLHASSYLASRLSWIVLAFFFVFAAGLLYRPRQPARPRRPSRFAKWLRQADVPAAEPATLPARLSTRPFAGLVASEFRLIIPGRGGRAAALLIALGSAVVDYRHLAGPAALLLLLFGLSAHIGRTEQPKLIALAETMDLSPWKRRCAFVLGAIGWIVAMGLPAILLSLGSGRVAPLAEAVGTGAVAAILALALGISTKGPFASRFALLLCWYVWFSL